MENKNINYKKIAIVLLIATAAAIVYKKSKEPKIESPEIERLKAEIKKTENDLIEMKNKREAKEREWAKNMSEDYMTNKARTERANAAIERARVEIGNALADTQGR